ncbi:MAG: hypothetical protein OES12_03695, partial [Anaerolineae bacterium]|nr:hypothetical protein [Anaerolineae bacterium]
MFSKLSTIAIEKTPAERRYWTLLLAVCLSFVFLQVFLAPTLPLTYEEGTNLLVGQLSSQGYQPYTQIFTMLSPSFVWLMAWLGRLGLSPTDFRLVFLIFGLLLLVNTSIITRTLLGIKVALVTVILLATATSFLAEAATTIAPINPAMSIGTLALVFTLQHINTKQRLWLLIGGAAWGIALFLSTSVFSLGLLAMIFIILLDRGRDNAVIFSPEKWQGKFRAMLLWLVGALVTLGVGVVWATPDIIFGHLMADYLTIRENLA